MSSGDALRFFLEEVRTGASWEGLRDLVSRLDESSTAPDDSLLRDIAKVVSAVETDLSLLAYRESARKAGEALRELSISNSATPVQMIRSRFGQAPQSSVPPALPHFEFVPREYQKQWFEGINQSIRAGRDRGLIRAQYQTGKSFVLGPMAQQFGREHFPGKTTLFIYPYTIIGAQTRDDLKNYPGRVGFIDKNRKDLEGNYDIIVASAFTLGRDSTLSQLDPDKFGLVVIDEATFSLAPTWRKILTRFGFLDPHRNIQKVDGKYLLGLTADPFRLQNIFGSNARLDTQGLNWYVNKGYLHRPIGRRVSFSLKEEDFQVIEEPGETISTPLVSQVFDQAVVEVYRQNLGGQKTLINVASIAHAQALEEAFDRSLGKGVARAVYSGMNEDEIGKICDAYSKGTGPKVLISIWKLAYGFRATGTKGIINTYQTDSLRRYGQRVGRALGIHGDEKQRDILVIDMQGKGHLLNSPTASLPKLFGIFDHQEEGIDYNPMRQIEKSKLASLKLPKIRARAKGDVRGFLTFKYSEEGDLFLTPVLFPKLLHQTLVRRFRLNMARMADVMGIDISELDRYLYGELPRTLAEAKQFNDRLSFPDKLLIKAWEKDALKIMDRLYPIPEETGPHARELVGLVRRATLYRGKGSQRSALKPDELTYENMLRDVVSGKFRWGSPASLNFLYRFILESGVADKSQIGIVMGRACREVGVADYDAMETEIVPLELNTALGEDDYENVWKAYDPDRTQQDAFDDIAKKELLETLPETLRLLLASLKPKYEVVLRGRFFEDKSFNEIGKELDVTQQTIHETEIRALKKLRHPSRSYRLSSFIEADVPPRVISPTVNLEEIKPPAEGDSYELVRHPQYNQDLRRKREEREASHSRSRRPHSGSIRIGSKSPLKTSMLKRAVLR